MASMAMAIAVLFTSQVCAPPATKRKRQPDGYDKEGSVPKVPRTHQRPSIEAHTPPAIELDNSSDIASPGLHIPDFSKLPLLHDTPSRSPSTSPTTDPAFYQTLPSLPAPLVSSLYDPDFGSKVRARYLKGYCKAQEARTDKYGRYVAAAFPPGRTPVEAREAYEIAQVELTRQTEEDSSESEDNSERPGDNATQHERYGERPEDDKARPMGGMVD